MGSDIGTVLVTGANGFVGGRIAARLVDEGAQVRALVRRPGEATILDRTGIEEIAGDFTDPDDAREAADGVDAVVHCAATAGEDLDAVRQVNKEGTRTIARAALDAGVDAFVHISTGSVYGDRDADTDVVEDSPRKEEGDPYGVTKAEAEREVERAAEEGLRTTILRPPAVLGWGPTSTWGQRIPSKVREGELPFDPGEGTTFAWVHVDDLAEAAVLALRGEAAAGRIYNVVGGHETFGRYFGDVRGWFDAEGEPLDDEAHWTGRMPAVPINQELGWEPRWDYETAMAEAASRWEAADGDPAS